MVKLDIRDDSSANVLLLQGSSLLQVNQEMDELDRSVESLIDTSLEIRNIATEACSGIHAEAEDMELWEQTNCDIQLILYY